MKRSVVVSNWTFEQLQGACPVMCDIAYSGAGELPQSTSDMNFTRGVLMAELTASDAVKFTHPAFGTEDLLVQRKHIGDQLELEREMIVVRVPWAALDEQPEINLTAPSANTGFGSMTCSQIKARDLAKSRGELP